MVNSGIKPAAKVAPPLAVSSRDLGNLMTAALQPYRLLDRFQDARRGHQAIERVLAADLGAPKTRRLIAQYLDRLPSSDVISSAIESITNAIETVPSSRERRWLCGSMLDGLAIRSGGEIDGYLAALDWTLADVAADDGERSARWKTLPHIPAPALARTVTEIWATHRGNYGRPPPIADVIELAARNRYWLNWTRHEVEVVAKDRDDLEAAAADCAAWEATADAPIEGWDIGKGGG